MAELRHEVSLVMEGWVPGAILGAIATLLSGFQWFADRTQKESYADGLTKAQLEAQEKLDSLVRDDIRQLRSDIAKGQDETRAEFGPIRSRMGDISALQASQSVVNQMVSNAVDSLVKTVDGHGEKLLDLAATVKLHTELLVRAGKG